MKSITKCISQMVLCVAFCSISYTVAATQSFPQKQPIDQFLAPAATKIEANLKSFPIEKISLATQYYTPLFAAGPNGKLKPEDRYACLSMEGTCIAGDFLYSLDYPNGIQRNKVQFKFGTGSRSSQYNSTGAVSPCRTLAADSYQTGTVIFIPSMKGKTCPQSGKPVDGAFIVTDTGPAIKGQGRFDLFVGECVLYSIKTFRCTDPTIAAFGVAPGTPFYVISRNDPLAEELRQESDMFIKSGWRRY